jgi:hypothetical protein
VVWSVIVFVRCQLLCPISATLSGQLLSVQGGAIQFWVQSTVPQDYLSDHPLPYFGRFACCPTPTLSLCPLSHFCSLRIWLLAPLLFSEADSVFHPTPTVCSRLQFTDYVFSWQWGFNLLMVCTVLCSQCVGRGVVCGACCSPVGPAALKLARNGGQLFSWQTLTGTWFRMSQYEILFDHLWPGGFFPLRADMPIGCAMLRFSWLLGAIKSCFKGQSLNFMCTWCVPGY